MDFSKVWSYHRVGLLPKRLFVCVKQTTDKQVSVKTSNTVQNRFSSCWTGREQNLDANGGIYCVKIAANQGLIYFGWRWVPHLFVWE